MDENQSVSWNTDRRLVRLTDINTLLANQIFLINWQLFTIATKSHSFWLNLFQACKSRNGCILLYILTSGIISDSQAPLLPVCAGAVLKPAVWLVFAQCPGLWLPDRVGVKKLPWPSRTAPFPASTAVCSPAGHPGAPAYMLTATIQRGRKVLNHKKGWT